MPPEAGFACREARCAWRERRGKGGGPRGNHGFLRAVNLIRFDAPPGYDDSYTKVAGELIVGTSVPTQGHQFFGEFKLGLGDSATPDLKLLVGLNFKR